MQSLSLIKRTSAVNGIMDIKNIESIPGEQMPLGLRRFNRNTEK
jgi:hypothetical protein